MAFATKSHVGDGSTTDFAVTFDYLDRSHVVVRVNKVETTALGATHAFSWVNDTTIRVVTYPGGVAAAVDADIEFIRRTPINTPAVVFGGGAALSSENLNKNSEYLTFALQEATDISQSFTKLYLGAFDEAPVTDNEGEVLQVGAVYYDKPLSALFYWTGTDWIIGESTFAAGVFKEAAEAAAAAALVSQNAAAASQSASAGSASAASTSASNASASATAAASSETNAAASATAAAGSATTAGTQAANAATSASTATTKASEASSSASAAATSASTASTGATTATTKASEAAASATGAAASASTATTKAAEADASADAALASKDEAAVLVDNASNLAGHNAVINGNFDIWQRGVSFSANGYAADRWINTVAVGTKTLTRQAFAMGQTDVPNNPSYYSQSVVGYTAAAGAYAVDEQRIEGVKTFSGQTVTLSFWFKADSPKNIGVELVQVFGTGGSPSPDVTGIGSQLIAVTAGWAKYTVTIEVPSVAGKVVGTAGNANLSLLLWYSAGSTYSTRAGGLSPQAGTFSLAQVKLEVGNIATPFGRTRIPEELALCQRYYEVGRVFFQGAFWSGIWGGGSSATYAVTKRAVPSVSLSILDHVGYSYGLALQLPSVHSVGFNCVFNQQAGLVDVQYISDAEL